MLCCAAQGLLSVPGQKWRSKLHVPFFILFSQGITCRRPTHRHTGLSPQVYRSSTCERRDQPQLRLTRKNVITYKYNFLLKLADEIDTIWCEESARWLDRWFECERTAMNYITFADIIRKRKIISVGTNRILILNLNSRRNKNLYHRWTADAFVISLDVQPHIIMWDYYSNQKGPPGVFFFLFCVSLRIRRAPAVSAHIQQQFCSLLFSSVRCAPGSGLPSFLLVHRSLPPPPPCASLQPMPAAV